MKNDQVLPRPPGCCDECIQTAAVKHEAMIAVYCDHNKTGAWMHRHNGELTGRWMTVSPMPGDEFAMFLSQLVGEKVRRLM